MIVNAKKLTTTYVVALSLIAFLLLSSQLIVQYFLKNQASDSKVVNIAGRQRMLSQRLTKYALLLERNPENEEYWTAFKKSYQLFYIFPSKLDW